MYAIVCKSRYKDEMLALIDRNHTRSKWWTSTESFLILKIVSKTAAEKICSKYLYNAASVVSYNHARDIIDAQSNEAIHRLALADSSLGWDAHKDNF
ncbi:MAG: hypothetical protein U5R06_02380 [candidate division KSB1 bacterium]|nr:hypothetical protein [candidate division KSB1 bacterium]